MKLICIRSLAVVLLLVNVCTADDWPQFRGPAGDGISAAANVPVQWSAAENIEWKTEIPGSGWSSPILSGGRLYVTTATGDAESDDISLRAVCLDAASGQIDWNVEVFRPDAAVARQVHTKNSLASSTPVIAEDRLYVHFGHMGTAALDLDGTILWQQTVSYRPVHGNGGSPALAGDLLVFSCDAAADPFVAALDRNDGDVRWRTPRNTTARQKFSFSTPLVIDVDGRQQIISAGSGFVGAYDPQDGREIWRVRYGEGYSVVPRPVFAGGTIFVSSGFNRPRLVAIDPKGAQSDATESHVLWTHERGAPLTPSMIVVGDELYMVADNGVATCLDLRTRRPHWTERLAGDFSASPVLAEGRVYFVNEEGTAYVVKADKDYELLATNELGERSLASPAVDDGALYLRTESYLWRVGRRNKFAMRFRCGPLVKRLKILARR
jgi:outer membrane protein assembly factor BamB